MTDPAGPTTLESFAYDANGNRLSADGVSYGTPDLGNRLTSDGVYSYDYDDEGNTTVKSKSGERWEYTSDDRNRLVEAKKLTGVSGTVLSYGTNQLDGNGVNGTLTALPAPALH